MSEHPMPTIVCSSLAEQGARTTIDALAAGALSIITKPRWGVKQFAGFRQRSGEQRTGVEAIAALRALLGESLPAKLYRKLVDLQQSAT